LNKACRTASHFQVKTLLQQHGVQERQAWGTQFVHVRASHNIPQHPTIIIIIIRAQTMPVLVDPGADDLMKARYERVVRDTSIADAW
jgi:hypothetical protein